jgi:hypothetical protein
MANRTSLGEDGLNVTLKIDLIGCDRAPWNPEQSVQQQDGKQRAKTEAIHGGQQP